LARPEHMTASDNVLEWEHFTDKTSPHVNKLFINKHSTILIYTCNTVHLHEARRMPHQLHKWLSNLNFKGHGNVPMISKLCLH